MRRGEGAWSSWRGLLVYRLDGSPLVPLRASFLALRQIGLAARRFHGVNGVGQDAAEGAAYFSAAAEAEDPVALANYGYMLANGWGVAPDPARAVELFEKAAGMGHAGGMVGLGFAHYHGLGVPQVTSRRLGYGAVSKAASPVTDCACRSVSRSAPARPCGRRPGERLGRVASRVRSPGGPPQVTAGLSEDESPVGDPAIRSSLNSSFSHN